VGRTRVELVPAGLKDPCSTSELTSLFSARSQRAFSCVSRLVLFVSRWGSVVGAGVEPAQHKAADLQSVGLTDAQPHHAIWGVGASIALALDHGGEHWTHVSCAPKTHAGQIPSAGVGGVEKTWGPETTKAAFPGSGGGLFHALLSAEDPPPYVPTSGFAKRISNLEAVAGVVRSSRPPEYRLLPLRSHHAATNRLLACCCDIG
jgi:hypothetical protein